VVKTYTYRLSVEAERRGVKRFITSYCQSHGLHGYVRLSGIESSPAGKQFFMYTPLSIPACWKMSRQIRC
jgi:hypothetical protein